MRFPLLLAATALPASLLALGGCTMAPATHVPSPPVRPALPVDDAHRSADGAVVQAADLAWADFFTDPALKRVIGGALANNRDMAIMLARVEQAQARVRVQQADLLPTLGAQGSATFQKTPPGLAGTTGATGTGTGTSVGGSATRLDIYQASVGVSSWEIDLFGRLRSLTEAARQDWLASEANRQATRTALIAQVATAWLTLAADRDRMVLARETMETSGATRDITRARAKEGVASDLDLEQAETVYQQARSDLADATTAAAQDRNALELLAGAPVADGDLPQGLGAAPVTISDLPGELPSTVLLRRPDIAAAEHQLRAANANIGAARAAFFPQISLTAALGTMSLGLSNLFQSGSGFWSVAPSATVPIFDWGRNAGNLKLAKAQRDEMVATYEKAVQTGFRETADALARRATMADQLAAQTQLEGSAGRAYRIASARYGEGVDSFLTTLDSQRSWIAARRTLLAARFQQQANAIELYRALGGGLS